MNLESTTNLTCRVNDVAVAVGGSFPPANLLAGDDTLTIENTNFVAVTVTLAELHLEYDLVQPLTSPTVGRIFHVATNDSDKYPGTEARHFQTLANRPTQPAQPVEQGNPLINLQASFPTVALITLTKRLEGTLDRHGRA